MITTINVNEKTKRNNARSIFKDKVKLIIDRKTFILKFIIVK